MGRIVVGLLLSLGIFLVCFGTMAVPTHYMGQEVFSSEDAYNTFKNAIVQCDATLQSSTVLSSEPPIIVNFDVIIPDKNLVFPYGTKQGAFNAAHLAGILSLVGGIAVFFSGYHKSEDDNSS